MGPDKNKPYSHSFSGPYRLPPAPHVPSIPMFGGRPVRDCPIAREDIVDLKIALYTSTSLKQFLSLV